MVVAAAGGDERRLRCDRSDGLDRERIKGPVVDLEAAEAGGLELADQVRALGRFGEVGQDRQAARRANRPDGIDRAEALAGDIAWPAPREVHREGLLDARHVALRDHRAGDTWPAEGILVAGRRKRLERVVDRARDVPEAADHALEPMPAAAALQGEGRLELVVVGVDPEPEDVDLTLSEVEPIGGDRVELDPREEVQAGWDVVRVEDVADAGERVVVGDREEPDTGGGRLGDELRRSQQIDVFYNANMTDIRLFDDLSGVKHVRVQNYNGRKVEVTAGQYVVAGGGLENPRILLNANSQIPQGIGNQHDMVGRCFMESLNVPAGRFLVTDPDFWQREREIYLWSSEALVHRKNTGVGVVAFSSNVGERVMRHAGRLRVLREFLHQTGCYTPAFRDLARKFVEFACPGDGIVHTMIEQEPNRNSRVSLMDDVDEFGLRRIQFNWAFSERDFRTIRTLVFEAAKEMARLNLARAQLAQAVLDPGVEFGYVHGHSHHMGTTRMSADPRHGVVDANCKVHGIRNLYVAGASTFSKCGGRNPTLTVVLLALRLGHHLGQKV